MFWCLSSVVFSGYSGFLPSFISYWPQPMKNKAIINVICAQSVAHDLLMTAPSPFEHTQWRQFTVQWGNWAKSQITPFRVIISDYCYTYIIIESIDWYIYKCLRVKPWHQKPASTVYTCWPTLLTISSQLTFCAIKSFSACKSCTSVIFMSSE